MGCYVEVVNNWPPTDFCPDPQAWAESIKKLGQEWRVASLGGNMPTQVRTWWDQVYSRYTDNIDNICTDRALVQTLIQLLAAADEASNAIGPGSPEDGFNKAIRKMLATEGDDGATLGRQLKVKTVRVLPKFHTPQTGMTLRSLSHYLAMYESGEVRPKWIIPEVDFSGNTLNILLVPFPWNVKRSQFSAVPGQTSGLVNMHQDKYGFFAFAPENDDDLIKDLDALIDEAKKNYGDVHGVILPELALTEDARDKVMKHVCEQGMFFVSGVAGKSGDAQSNLVSIGVPDSIGTQSDEPMIIEDVQYKHHRWQVERNQILQYGLGSKLDPSVKWWEGFPLGNRDLLFITLNKNLTVCVLICEDLAKQDPVASLIRAIGPNLVVALLMDAPQLTFRWPGRYATVLADDPGSSVLTLTSLGMVKMSKPSSGTTPSKSVALWKDPVGGVSMHLEVDDLGKKSGILLSINRQLLEEHSADGRSDGGGTSGIAYAGHHVIEIETPPKNRVGS
jgi:hypothetical protein